MHNYILDTVRYIFEKHFMISANQLSLQKRLCKDLSLNQYEFNEMLFYVEDEFHIHIDDHELPAIRTVGDLIYCVERHRL